MSSPLTRAAVARLEAEASTDPGTAIETSTLWLGRVTSARSRAEVLWIRGQAHRRLRHVNEAIADLREAVSLGREVGNRRLLAQLMTTYAGAVAYRGDVTDALAILAEAPVDVGGKTASDIETQRGFVLQRAGRRAEAEQAFGAALDLMPRGKPRDRADLLTNRGILRTYAGLFTAAEADFTEALRLYERLALDHIVTETIHNIAWLDGRRGEIIRSLAGFDRAATRYTSQSILEDSRYPDECESLLAAGLVSEAHRRAQRAADAFQRAGNSADAAETLLLAARAALGNNDPESAARSAASARELFRSTSRPGWEAEASLLAMDARIRGDLRPAPTVTELEELAHRLDTAGLRSAGTDALLLVARVALAEGDFDLLATMLRRCACRNPTTQQRIAALAVRARYETLNGSRRAARRAIGTGAALLDAVRRGLGAPELRAHLAVHGVELGDLDVELSLQSGSPVALLSSTERWRAAALRHPRLRPPDDELLSSLLHELRVAEFDARSRARDGAPDLRLEREVRELQRAVVQRARTSETATDRPLVPPSLRQLARLIEDRTMLVIAEHRGHLFSIVPAAGRAAVHPLGPASPVHEEVVHVAAALRRLLVAPPDLASRHLQLVEIAAERLDAALLAQLSADGGEAVLVLPASLAAVPWACLPRLRHRPFTVVPSVGLWAHLAVRAGDCADAIVLAAGPDLQFADREIESLGTIHRSPVVLSSSRSTPAALLSALDGAAVAHLACHGTITSDNPLFSQLQVCGGPLYVYDLEQLTVPPVLTVLSACYVGAAGSRPGDELLGFTTSLLGLGGRSVIAAVQAVPDTADAMQLMTNLHLRLVLGDGPARALAFARAAAEEHGSFVGWVFSCFGMG